MTIESGVTLDPIGAEIFFDKSKLEKLLDKGNGQEWTYEAIITSLPP